MHVPGAHDALEFELQLVELLTMWMLGVESRSSRKSSQYSSHHFTVCSAPEKLIFNTPTCTPVLGTEPGALCKLGKHYVFIIFFRVGD